MIPATHFFTSFSFHYGQDTHSPSPLSPQSLWRFDKSFTNHLNVGVALPRYANITTQPKHLDSVFRWGFGSTLLQLVDHTRISQTQRDTIRVTSKKRDDLQEVMSLLKGQDLEIPLQFDNFRD